MALHPCPTCRKPAPWEANPHRPFCSERCRTRDLAAWASEDYRIAQDPAQEEGEGWSGERQGEGGAEGPAGRA